MHQRLRANDWTCLQLLSVIMVLASILLVAFTRFATIASFPELHPRFTSSHKQPTGAQIPGLRVDLGYELYEGVANLSTGLNVFKG